MQVGAQRLVAALVDLDRAGEHLPAGPWCRFRCHTADLPGEARPAGQADHRPVTPDLLHFLPFRPCWLRFESDSSPWSGRGHDHVTVSTMSGATASSTLFTFDRLTWNACGSPGTPGTPDPWTSRDNRQQGRKSCAEIRAKGGIGVEHGVLACEGFGERYYCSTHSRRSRPVRPVCADLTGASRPSAATAEAGSSDALTSARADSPYR